MDPELLFTICTFGVLPFWLLLVVAPAWRWTSRIVHNGLAPGLFALVYSGCLVYSLLYGEPSGGDGGSLAGVQELFTVEWVVLIGWLHFIALDLFVGAWEVRDARARGVPHLAVVPCLLLTLVVGPAGLLSYLVLRRLLGRPAKG